MGRNLHLVKQGLLASRGASIHWCAMIDTRTTPAADVLQLIGNTPLIRLKGPSEATGCEILAKCEFMNPGGSVKDRAALFIVEDAEARGALEPGRSEEHTSELQSLMRISYAVFCLKKK